MLGLVLIGHFKVEKEAFVLLSDTDAFLFLRFDSLIKIPIEYQSTLVHVQDTSEQWKPFFKTPSYDRILKFHTSFKSVMSVHPRVTLTDRCAQKVSRVIATAISKYNISNSRFNICQMTKNTTRVFSRSSV